MKIDAYSILVVLSFLVVQAEQRMEELSDGVLFMVIVFTGLAMTIGLLLNSGNQRKRLPMSFDPDFHRKQWRTQ